MNHTMHTSEKLNELHWEQPKKYELTWKIYSLLEQFSNTPNAEKIIQNSRLSLLIEDTEKLAQETWENLHVLKIETMIASRIKTHYNQLALIQEKIPQRISDIMISNNYDNIQATA